MIRLMLVDTMSTSNEVPDSMTFPAAEVQSNFEVFLDNESKDTVTMTQCEEIGYAIKDCTNKAKANPADDGSPPQPTTAAITAALAVTRQSRREFWIADSNTIHIMTDSLRNMIAFKAINEQIVLAGGVLSIARWGNYTSNLNRRLESMFVSS